MPHPTVRTPVMLGRGEDALASQLNEQVGSAGGRPAAIREAVRARFVRPRAGREMAAALVIALTVAGAALAAGLHPASAAQFRAVAFIVPPQPSAGVSGPTAFRALAAGFVRSGAVFAPGATLSVASSTGGAVKVVAGAPSQPAALAAANSVAAQVVELVELVSTEAVGPGQFVVGSFAPGGGLGGWGGASDFSSSPVALTIGRVDAHLNPTYLTVQCGGRVGCGIGRRLPLATADFLPYSAAAWVRAVDTPLRLSLILGAGPGAYRQSRPLQVGRAWKHLSVSWTPQALGSVPEVDVIDQGGRGRAFALDSVTLTDPALAPGGQAGSAIPSQSSGVLDAWRSASVLAARPLAARASDTIGWTGIGAGIGLAIGLLGVGAGWAAGRRQRGVRAAEGP